MSFTRRELFGLGAVGVTAGASGQNVFSGLQASALEVPEALEMAAALAPPTPGLSYMVVSSLDFHPSPTSDDRNVGTLGVYPTSSARMYAPLRLPPGARLREITIGAYLTTDSGAFSARPNLQIVLVDAGRFNIGLDIEFAAGSMAVQTATAESDRLSTHGSQLYLTIDLPGGSGHQIVGALFGYEPPVQGFVPITPTRVYDSRFDMTPDASGVLAANSERSFSIADSRDVATGAITSPDVVPDRATAIAYNLTIATPTGLGFISVNPASAIAIGAASINWGPEPEGPIANAGIVQIDDDRRVRLFSGPGGAAHTIVDVTGYFI